MIIRLPLKAFDKTSIGVLTQYEKLLTIITFTEVKLTNFTICYKVVMFIQVIFVVLLFTV